MQCATITALLSALGVDTKGHEKVINGESKSEAEEIRVRSNIEKNN